MIPRLSKRDRPYERDDIGDPIDSMDAMTQ
jgi:hypothetical protein